MSAQKCFCRPRVTAAPAFATALSASLLRSPQTGVTRAIPYKLYWTTLSTSPSMGARVSFRIGPLPRGPIPNDNYFAFRENPFSLTPNPRFLHRTRQAHETLSRLTRGILDRKGLILLSGEVGTGKTTLLYTALHLMSVSPAVQNKIGTAVIVHPTLTRDEFLEAVLDEFDVPCDSTSRQRRMEALLKMLLEVRRRNGVAVLVIDEAQMLTIDLLDEIRSLLGLQTSHEKLLQVVLCGQPEIEARLDGTSVRRGEPFVAVRCKTAPLSLKDTHDYVQHRLRIAGARTDALFMPEAVDAVHVHTNGIPRLINLLCAQALSVAAGYQAERVFPYMVDEAAAKICSGAQIPPSSPDSPGTPSGTALPTLLLNPSSTPLLSRSLTTFRALPMGCEPVQVKVVVSNSEPAKLEPAELAHPNATDAMPLDTTATDADPVIASPVDASSDPRSMPMSSARPKFVHAHEDGPRASPAAVQAARKKRRALRRREKFAQAAKRAQVGGRPKVKCDFAQDSGPNAAGFRRSGSRPSPFRRGRVRASHRRADLGGFRQISVAGIVALLCLWNQWLNRWCSEHFTSKSCGRPLFQLGLAGTLFLALAQAIAAAFPRLHMAHVAFGFLGMLFIDISLGLGTYLLLLERGLTPGSRATWAQTLMDSWWSLRRRLD
jgi:general secretion pathway protein A